MQAIGFALYFLQLAAKLPAMIDSYQPGTLHQNKLPSLSSSGHGVLSQQKSESNL